MAQMQVPDLRFEEGFVAKWRNTQALGGGGALTTAAALKTVFYSVVVDPLVQSFFLAIALARLRPVFVRGRRAGRGLAHRVGLGVRSVLLSLYKHV